MTGDFHSSTIDEEDETSREDDDEEEEVNPIKPQTQPDEDNLFEDEVDGVSEQSVQRRKLVQRCRSLQELETEARERALRAIALAKMLKKDLEVALESTNAPELPPLFEALNEMKHVLIQGHSIQDLLIFVPGKLLMNLKSRIFSYFILYRKYGKESRGNLSPSTARYGCYERYNELFSFQIPVASQ